MWRSALIATLLLAGCASVPQASIERDAEAKQFITHPNSATLYVYRPDFWTEAHEESVLYVNSRLIGAALARSFFRIDLPAGDHLLHVYGSDPGRLRVTVHSGEITFISLSVNSGISQFRRVDPEKGRQEVLSCCGLLENWVPGQRPLLR